MRQGGGGETAERWVGFTDDIQGNLEGTHSTGSTLGRGEFRALGRHSLGKVMAGHSWPLVLKGSSDG